MLPTTYGIQKINSNVQYFFWGLGRASMAFDLLFELFETLGIPGGPDGFVIFDLFGILETK
jgi:hypothetical protein